MSETDERAPRLAVWAFCLSLAGCAAWLASIATYFAVLADLGPDALSPLAWGLLASALNIPGLLLSLRGLRIARKRCAPRGLAIAGIVLGAVGTVAALLYIALVILLIEQPVE